jgi:S-DNA-T family DNA segregation ATPase FtsK/SpoIIIE
MPSSIGALKAEARRSQARPAGPVITPVVGGVQIGPLDVDMADGGTFVIGGPRRSGRSTALLACLASLRLPRGTPDVVVITPRRSPLRAWAGAATVLEQSDTLAADLSQAMKRKPAALAIDDAELLADHPVAGILSDLVRAAFDGGLMVFVAGSTSEMCRRYSGWLYQARQGRAGLILQPSAPSDGELLEVSLPRSVAAPGRRPPGRGVLVAQGGWTSAQVIDYDGDMHPAATFPEPSVNTHLASIGEHNDL